MNLEITDIVVKDVSEEYEKARKKREKVAIEFNFLLGFLLLGACFFPVANIGKYSIGNTFEFLFSFIKQCFSSKTSSVNHLTYFAFFHCFFFFIGIFFLWRAIVSWKNKNFKSKKKFINQKDENLIFSHRYIFKRLGIFLLFLIICYALIENHNIVLKNYGFSSFWCWIVILFFLLFFVKGTVCSFITLKYDEKGKPTEQAILSPVKKQKNKKFILKKFRNYLSVILLFSMVTVLFICSTYHSAMFGGYTTIFLKDSVSTLIMPIEKELSFDQYYENITWCIKSDGYGCKEIELTENTTKSFVIYGDSYDYAKAKTEELTAKILALMPEKNDSNALEQYLEKTKKFANAIELLNSHRSHPYEYISFVNGYLVDVQYNATGNNEIKWGVKQDGLKSLIFHEKISLTNTYCINKKDMNRFVVGTDFSKELIVARVRYNDGSVRISKITPSNLIELNNAKAGKHLLKWSDSWGNYETIITLYE